MTRSIKISVLWLLTISGFACHSICDVLPLFWGKNMAVAATDNAGQYMIMPMMIVIGVTLAWYSIKYVKED